MEMITEEIGNAAGKLKQMKIVMKSVHCPVISVELIHNLEVAVGSILIGNELF